jgi:hypothetical protein
VHADQRLSVGAQRIGQEQLGHHDALEQVRRLADHHRVDVRPVHLGIRQRTVDRLPAQAGHGHVEPLGRVLGLPRAEYRGELLGHLSRVLP